jgi:hypothetical protein
MGASKAPKPPIGGSEALRETRGAPRFRRRLVLLARRADLEADPRGDERSGAGVSQPEPPRHVPNGIAGRPPTPDGAENLAHDAPQPRRGSRSKREHDVDVRGHAVAPAPRQVAVDVRTEAAVSRRHSLLRLARPTVGGVRRRIFVVRPRIDPRRDAMAELVHLAPPRRGFRAKAQPAMRLATGKATQRTCRLRSSLFHKLARRQHWSMIRLNRSLTTCLDPRIVTTVSA